mmetsp:Transcript_27078/g.77855  ORF Transcript_27078/g.77855 Transcript_27078/m.77855 type:complete len:152 (+) Transcript_27078:237-692(+)
MFRVAMLAVGGSLKDPLSLQRGGYSSVPSSTNTAARRTPRWGKRRAKRPNLTSELHRPLTKSLNPAMIYLATTNTEDTPSRQPASHPHIQMTCRRWMAPPHTHTRTQTDRPTDRPTDRTHHTPVHNQYTQYTTHGIPLPYLLLVVSAARKH